MFPGCEQLGQQTFGLHRFAHGGPGGHTDQEGLQVSQIGQIGPHVFSPPGHGKQVRVCGSERIARQVRPMGQAAIDPLILFCSRLAYRFLVEDDLRSGTLVEVLQAFGGASRPFSLIYPASRHMPQRVRVLIEFLLHGLRQHAPRQ